jgi:hypothetical protein
MNITFIYHSFHKITKSSNLFVELLEKGNDVYNVYCNLMKTGVLVDLNELKDRYNRCIYSTHLIEKYEKILI